MNKGITCTLITASIGISTVFIGTVLNKRIKERDKALAKMHELYMTFDQWLQVRQQGKTLVEYFQQQNYQTVAIYGMKELGERLYDELKGSNIIVPYIIDKNADTIYTEVNVVTPDEELDLVDVIVVTAIYYFDEIEEMLSKKVNCPIISLEDVLHEM